MSLDTCDPDLKPILSRVFSLYLASVVEKNLNRVTVLFGVLWAVCIVALGILIKA